MKPLILYKTTFNTKIDSVGNERIECPKCGDRRIMKNTKEVGVYECQGCNQLWKIFN